MIHEPQQPEIEIPLINSMSTTVNSLKKSELLSISKNQNNTMGQSTLIQIPQQNLKPRIFLLTKPSITQLTRLNSQTVQPHHRRNSNLSQLHCPQESVLATPITLAANQRQTETVRVPFLPGPRVQTLSAKSNTNHMLKKNSKINRDQYQNKSQIKEVADQTIQKKSLILQQVIQLPTSLADTRRKQIQTQQKSGQNTVTKNIVKDMNLSEDNTIETQTQTQPNTPLTLASMAGIELTGADMSLSQADMSGAMLPTATVEEIHVPVFIDEYLQEATATTTTTASTTSVTTNNIFNINNNSNNICNNISNNQHSDEIGNEENLLNTLDDFEFDINMLTDSKKNALEIKEDQPHLHQQQQSNEVDDDDNLTQQHQLELQMMVEKIMLNNNNYTTSNNNNSNNIIMAANIDITDDLFKVSPYTELNDFLSPDDIENSSFGTTQFDSEEAVDLNSISKDFTLDECFINSQPTEIMFSSGYSQSQSSSQNLINEISKAEPHIKPKHTAVATTSANATTIDMEECDLNDEHDNIYTVRFVDDNSIANCKETTKSLLSNPLKRNSSQTSQHMFEKRLKLRLDIKQSRENVVPHQSEITTPKVIDFIDQFNDIMGTTTADSIKTIYDDLMSTSPKCISVKSEINADDSTNDFSPPNTPYSVNSISNQTCFINTAPSSPASSIATTSNTSITAKRGRGRPAKTHSDIPDRSQIQHLSENEQKKLLERAKNNEASRKSRLKNKERDNALEREEAELKTENLKLKKEWEEWHKMENKLKAALKRQYFNFQNDQ